MSLKALCGNAVLKDQRITFAIEEDGQWYRLFSPVKIIKIDNRQQTVVVCNEQPTSNVMPVDAVSISQRLDSNASYEVELSFAKIQNVKIEL